MANSLGQQVRNGIVAVRAFGISRHAAKRARQARDQIHTKKTERKLIERCITCVRLIRGKHQFRESKEIRREWVVELFHKLVAGEIVSERTGKPYSVWTIRNMAAALRKLQRGLRKAYPCYRFTFMEGLSNGILGIPPRRLHLRRGVSERGDRALSPEEAEAVIGWLRTRGGGKAEQAARILELQFQYGLRLGKELFRGKFRRLAGTVCVKGKGGRWRETALTPAGMAEIASLRRLIGERTVNLWVARAVAALGLRPEYAVLRN